MEWEKGERRISNESFRDVFKLPEPDRHTPETQMLTGSKCWRYTRSIDQAMYIKRRSTELNSE